MKPIADYFKNARVGDRVEHVDGDIGTVEEIRGDSEGIGVKFGSSELIYYGVDGTHIANSKHQHLYYEGIEIIPPPEPKRKKKVWVNLYRESGGRDNELRGWFHLTKQDAEKQMKCERIACVEIEVVEK